MGAQGVASRDIKLENTLLDGSPRPLLKICDFGYSKVPALGFCVCFIKQLSQSHACVSVLLDRQMEECRQDTYGGADVWRLCMQHEKFQSAPGSRVGTPAYLAPEVIMTTKGQTYDGKVQPCRCIHGTFLGCVCSRAGTHRFNSRDGLDSVCAACYQTNTPGGAMIHGRGALVYRGDTSIKQGEWFEGCCGCARRSLTYGHAGSWCM